MWDIVALSLRISLSATLIAAFFAIPIGTALAMGRFTGRKVIIMFSSSLMALPPVVVGLAIYLLLSRSIFYDLSKKNFKGEEIILGYSSRNIGEIHTKKYKKFPKTSKHGGGSFEKCSKTSITL